MHPRWLFAVFFVIFLILPVNAHVPISVDNNNDITNAFTVEKPTKSYVIYGNLQKAGDVGYYRFRLNNGDRLTLSLMIPGFDNQVPDMIVMSPGTTGSTDALTVPVTVIPGYRAEIIKGQKPVKAEYEPFSPAAVFKVASYSKNITLQGTYYAAVISPADETRYSITVGYLEEFNFIEWIFIPVNIINTHLWEGQSILTILAPFLGVSIFGIVLIVRRKTGSRKSLFSWLTNGAGLCYLGGAAIVIVQMVRVLRITGISAGVILTLVFALLPFMLGVFALRIARLPAPHSLKSRLSLGVIGLAGLVFWAGLIIGPVMAFLAALAPSRE